MKNTIDIIIDTDIGNDIDDTWAIVYALLNDRFCVKAICVTGCDTEYKACLIAKILTNLNRSDVAIIKGVPYGEPFAPQKAWIGNFTLSDFRGKVFDDTRKGFEEYLKNGTVVIGLAPNSTLAFVRDILLRKNATVVAMAGSVFKGYFGNPNPVPECNVVTDTEASKKLYASGVNYTMLPLDVCGNIVLEGAKYERVCDSHSIAARIVTENYFVWNRDYIGGAKKYDIKKSSTVLYDMIPFFYLEKPEAFSVQKMKIGINERGITEESENGVGMQVAVGVQDLEEFYVKMTELLVK